MLQPIPYLNTLVLIQQSPINVVHSSIWCGYILTVKQLLCTAIEFFLLDAHFLDNLIHGLVLHVGEFLTQILLHYLFQHQRVIIRLLVTKLDLLVRWRQSVPVLSLIQIFISQLLAAIHAFWTEACLLILA